MRPGLTVSLLINPQDDFGSIPGSVVEVDHREVVIRFGRSASRLPRMLPGKSVRIGYRNQEDGCIYYVPAEFKAMDSPRSVALKLLGPPVIGEQRDHPRVERLLRMDYEVVPPAEVERVRTGILRGAQIIKYESQAPVQLHRLRPAAGGEEPPADAPPLPLIQQLARMEHKLDILLERLGIDARGIDSEKPLYNVSLSTRGIRFRDIDNRCSPGDTVRVRLELPLNPTVEMIALGEVQNTVTSRHDGLLSAGRDVVIEFKAMKAESRNAIERYCQLHRSKLRTA